ncbi:MAG TPA: sigma factor-like helix-turn-helix DNA-binding protein [Polyangiaceae bacterium]|nr:sigma factor-like helix-turn-helix DNA-binding protein [Polyangiaceae bacterium]
MATNEDASTETLETFRTEAGARRFFERAVPALTREAPTWCPELAWDTSVDAYLAVATHPERFEAPAQAYVYALTKIRRDRWRRRRRTWDREVTLDDVRAPVDPRTALETLAVSEELANLLGRLPQKLRETFVAIEGLGASAAEFAVEEGIAIQTVYNRMRHARRLLKRFIEEGA